MSPETWIRTAAEQLGFDEVGFAAAPAPDEPFAEGLRFRDWCAQELHGEMGYLKRTVDRRAEPHRALAGLRSAVVLTKRYPGGASEPGCQEGRVASYARGRDYHNVLLRPARKLLRAIVKQYPETSGRSFVDTGAVMEKAWAVRAGLGWLGKNTLLLHPERGSYRLLAVLFLTLELTASPPIPDQCSSCTLCLDACPTGAFPAPYVLDARRCISYLTIERRGDIPLDLRPVLADHLFGCDVCQEVCPWNFHSSQFLDPAFVPSGTDPSEVHLHEPVGGLLRLDEEGFVSLTRGRPLARPRREGLVRNACVVAGNSGDPLHVPDLTALLSDGSAVIRRHAAWALGALSRQAGEAGREGLRARLEHEEDADTRAALEAALAS